MEIFYCPKCEGKPYTDNIKLGTKCPKCGTTLKYENVNDNVLSNRKKLEYPGKKRKIKAVSKKKDSISSKYKKSKTLSGVVENIRPSAGEQRDLFTKFLHYIFYRQSWSDTLYSFDIAVRNEEGSDDKVHVHIYGDYYGDGATICSGFDHTVKGRMAIKNLSENDNDIFFAYHIRNNDSGIKFVRSPFAFMMTAFILFFIYEIIMAVKEPMMSGTMLDEMQRVFKEFVPSAKAAASLFSISFIASSFLIYVNKVKTHIRFNFNSVFIFSLMVTVLFFMKYKITQFADLSVSECFSLIIALIITSFIPTFAVIIGVFILWKILSLIASLRR